MCEFKSGILLKDRVFIPDYDHHTQMLEELGIADDTDVPDFVRVELIPPNNDPFLPIDGWRFKVDQDFRPDWFIEDIDRQRVVDAVKQWAASRIYIGIDGLELTTGAGYYLKDCINVTLRGDAQVREMWGSSQVGVMLESSQVREMWGSSQVGVMLESSQVGVMLESSQVREMWESSQVGEMWGSSQVGVMLESSQVGVMLESSQVREMWGSSQVGEMRESSQVRTSPYHAPVNSESLVLCDNATFVDAVAKTIYQSGDWKLVSVGAKEVV